MIRLLLLMLLPAVVSAAPPLPPPLEPWVDWVLRDAPERDCPFDAQQAIRHCSFASRLRVEVLRDEIQFSLQVQRHAPGWQWLPGGESLWPQVLRLDGIERGIESHQNRPALWLTSGQHRIEGQIRWRGLRPQQLRLPPGVAAVHLTLNDGEVPTPQIQGEHLLLRRPQAHARSPDEGGEVVLERVYRRLDDTHPLGLESRYRLRVSGPARLHTLPAALPEGFQPYAIESRLPVSIDEAQHLHIQVRPGQWEIVLRALYPSLLTENIQLPQDSPWGEEVWVHALHPPIRLTRLEGVEPFDPSQADLPPAYSGLPAYRLRPGETLTLDVVQRGRSERDSKPVIRTLQSRYRLLQNGSEWRLESRFQVQTPGEWLAAPRSTLHPDRAELLDRENLPLTIDDTEGVHFTVPAGTHQVLFEARAERAHALPLLPVHADSEGGRWVLELPPGWLLLATEGGEYIEGSWLSSWQMHDLYVLILLVLAVHFGCGRRVLLTATMLLTLLVAYVELPPSALLFLGALLAVLAMLAALPAEHTLWRQRLNSLARYATLFLLITLAPWFLRQSLLAAYPQLEPALAPQHWVQQMQREFQAPTAPAPPVGAELAMARREALDAAPPVSAQATLAEEEAQVIPATLDSQWRVQTGFGVPEGGYVRRYVLPISGPSGERTLNPWLLSPPFSTLWRLCSLLLMVLLLGQLIRHLRRLSASPALEP